MSNERFSCIRMTTCSTSLMVPVRLFAGIASARAGWRREHRHGGQARGRGGGVCRKRRLPAWTRSLSDFTDFFPFRGIGLGAAQGATQPGLPAAAASRAGCPDRPCRPRAAGGRQRHAQRQPRPGAGHAQDQGKFMLFYPGTSGEQFEHRLAGQRQRLTSSSARATRRPGRRNTCVGPGAGAAHAVLAGAVLVQPRKGP